MNGYNLKNMKNTVSENYVDTCGCRILKPIQTVLEPGSDYIKTAPCIQGYVFVGYKVNKGPMQAGEVRINGITVDINVVFVYKRECICCHYCY